MVIQGGPTVRLLPPAGQNLARTVLELRRQNIVMRGQNMQAAAAGLQAKAQQQRLAQRAREFDENVALAREAQEFNFNLAEQQDARAQEELDFQIKIDEQREKRIRSQFETTFQEGQVRFDIGERRKEEETRIRRIRDSLDLITKHGGFFYDFSKPGNPVTVRPGAADLIGKITESTGISVAQFMQSAFPEAARTAKLRTLSDQMAEFRRDQAEKGVQLTEAQTKNLESLASTRQVGGAAGRRLTAPQQQEREVIRFNLQQGAKEAASLRGDIQDSEDELRELALELSSEQDQLAAAQTDERKRAIQLTIDNAQRRINAERGRLNALNTRMQELGRGQATALQRLGGLAAVERGEITAAQAEQLQLPGTLEQVGRGDPDTASANVLQGVIQEQRAEFQKAFIRNQIKTLNEKFKKAKEGGFDIDSEDAKPIKEEFDRQGVNLKLQESEQDQIINRVKRERLQTIDRMDAGMALQYFMTTRQELNEMNQRIAETDESLDIIGNKDPERREIFESRKATDQKFANALKEDNLRSLSRIRRLAEDANNLGVASITLPTLFQGRQPEEVQTAANQARIVYEPVLAEFFGKDIPRRSKQGFLFRETRRRSEIRNDGRNVLDRFVNGEVYTVAKEAKRLIKAGASPTAGAGFAFSPFRFPILRDSPTELRNIFSRMDGNFRQRITEQDASKSEIISVAKNAIEEQIAANAYRAETLPAVAAALLANGVAPERVERELADFDFFGLIKRPTVAVGFVAAPFAVVGGRTLEF